MVVAFSFASGGGCNCRRRSSGSGAAVAGWFAVLSFFFCCRWCLFFFFSATSLASAFVVYEPVRCDAGVASERYRHCFRKNSPRALPSSPNGDDAYILQRDIILQQEELAKLEEVNGSLGESSLEEEEKETDQGMPSLAPPPPVVAAEQTPATETPSMDVDENGTGAMLSRARSSGGVDAPLMVSKEITTPMAFPIDSAKDGMEARDLKRATRTKRSDPRDGEPRLMRFAGYKDDPSNDNVKSIPPSSVTKKQSKLVRYSGGGEDDGAIDAAGAASKHNPKTKLVMYNRPDLEDTSDYDGMERSANEKAHVQSRRTKLVRYKPPPVDEEDEREDGGKGENKNRRNRPNLSEDLDYSNRYTEYTDHTMARKSGLSVNKPIGLWSERDKFL